MTRSAQVVVVGAGAAGLMAALQAARHGAEVVLIEGTKDGGRKILISGGGRCNILPSVPAPKKFVTDSSKNTLRKVLLSWPLQEQRAFFERELGLTLELEEESGKLFPSSHRARDVRDGLVARARDAGVRIWFGTRVHDVRPIAEGWSVCLDGAPPIVAGCVVIATGGLSVPKTGSDGAGLDWVKGLGHEVHPTYPALTPLTADPHPQVSLAGVSTVVTLRGPGWKPPFETTGGFLVTHRGWSGPSVLDVSHLATRGSDEGDRQEIRVRWCGLDSVAWDQILRDRAGTVRGAVADHLPRRLAEALIQEAGVEPDTPLSQLKRESRRAVVRTLTDYLLPWTGDEGYKKAEVTGGGVALSEIDPRTMESRIAPGLFLCGEILDAFGPIGGHNFMWAWATGRAAGIGAAAHASPD